MNRIARALGVSGLALVAACGSAESNEAPMDEMGAATMSSGHANPLVVLHESAAPQFGLYAPSAGGRARPGETPPPARTPADRAADIMAYGQSDYVFDGSMERGVDAGLPDFIALRDALHDAGATAASHPFIVKMSKIESAEQAQRDVATQLDAGASGIMFVEVETAEEARIGLEAMRYTANGGSRPDGVGSAPEYWDMDADEYRSRADLWPLNPDGDLVSWVIVESHEGLANVREIAAVPGIGVLWPGAGTLRGLFSTTDADGQRVLDEEAWENSIQQVLSACKEFDVPCGYPANASDIEMRMEQGFSVFVMGWGDAGFEAVEMGRSVAGR